MTVATTVDTFGARLRAVRQRAGLSQAEAGGERYSASYISHLESGRRQPTDEVITHLAIRLGVGLDELVATDQQAYASGSAATALLVANSALREAQRIGDPELICERANEVAAQAVRSRRADLWWHAECCRLHALVALGSYRMVCDIGTMLARHPITQGSAQLECEILAQLARAHRAMGELKAAIDVGSRARALADAHEVEPAVHVEVLNVHVAALMDSGETTEAAAATATLRELRDQVQSPQVRAQVAWVLGNVAFLTGDVTEGLAEHQQAMELFRPEVDLSLWARFRQASARMRLDAGLTDGVAELIDAAAAALSLVGSAADRANLEMVRAAQALAQGDPQSAVTLCDGVLEGGTALSPQSSADLYVLRHRALLALDETAAARESLRAAAELYEEAGAWQRAVVTWRTRADLEDDLTIVVWSDPDA